MPIRLLLAAALAAAVLVSPMSEAAPVPSPSATPATAASAPPVSAPALNHEVFTLPNGMTVILHRDPTLPQVVINTWFDVGSKDEAKGRSGFAHLFEHLMFMGTKRVPGNQFDVMMESGGGNNNASTANDRTNYYSTGPSSILPLLLWLDADRLDALADAMTQEKLDLQRDVVRNEMRQGIENTPYGIAELILPAALYPQEHPYRHPVIGSHEDLQAATLQDVKDFFATYYVPGNASLVVAGDFDVEKVKALVARTFGAIPARPVPSPRAAAPLVLDGEVRRVAVDEVEFPRLYLVWPAPKAFAPGSAELELLASGILGGSTSSRLERRLVLDTRLAQDVTVYLDDRLLVSEFHVEITAAPGADLERIKRETLDVIATLAAQGPTADEVARARAQVESGKRRQVEDLGRRADMLNQYRYFFGEPDGLARDLARFAAATPASVKDATARTLGTGRVDLRILPRGAEAAGASLDERPANFDDRAFTPPVPQTFKLANGMPVDVVARPGTGLFSARLVVDGGERAVPADKAGLAALTAMLLTSGAAGKSAPQFAEAVETLGARIGANADADNLEVAVDGLSAHLGPTLDLFADAVLKPNLAEEDFRREAALALANIDSRGDRPNEVAQLVARAQLFPAGDYRARPANGTRASVGSIALADVRAALPRLLDPSRARLVVVGDADEAALRRALDARLGAWRGAGAEVPPAGAPVEKAAARVVLVDRPGAPQTVIQLWRPVPYPDDAQRAVRGAVNTLFGGSFTSRLNQNLREKNGFTYGARSVVATERRQGLLRAGASVQTAVTGAALGEFRAEFTRLAKGDVSADELGKALRTARHDMMEAVQTTGSLADVLADLVASGRPVDSLRRHAAALDGVTLERANGEARSGPFGWDSLMVVLVGDKDEVLPQLKKAGLPEPKIVPVP